MSQIAFIGGGKMAEAIISGLIKGGLYPPENILVSDVDAARREYLHNNYRVKVYNNNEDVVTAAQTVVLAVKPQLIAEVLEPLAGTFASQLVISIAAGITLKKLGNLLSEDRPIVRVMPNTPCLIAQGISALACNKSVSAEHKETAKAILGSVGQVVETEEKYLNAITGLSGSGPAYVYLFVEALADAGVLAGLDRDLALTLAAQTVIGAASMVKETGQHPAQLKDAVTSPGGTTIAALHVLEHGRMRALLMDAVLVAMSRAAELSGE